MISYLACATIAAVSTLTCELHPQQRLGKRIALVVDMSGSMGASGAEGYALSAVRRFLENSSDEAEIKVYAFGDVTVEWPRGWAKFPDKYHMDFALRWLKDVRVGINDTRAADAIAKAMADEQDDFGIVLFSDGFWTDPVSLSISWGNAGRLTRGLTKAPVMVYGIGATPNMAALRSAAEEGKGGLWVETFESERPWVVPWAPPATR
jgi:hypothetical protein